MKSQNEILLFYSNSIPDKMVIFEYEVLFFNFFSLKWNKLSVHVKKLKILIRKMEKYEWFLAIIQKL